jgi:hypothetical protein
MVSWRPITLVWIDTHQCACCYILVLLLDFLNILHLASWVIFPVAVLVTSWWTNLYWHCSGVPANATLKVALLDRLDTDSLIPCSVVSESIISCCGLREEDDNEMEWEVVGNILIASSQNGTSNS